MPAAGHRNTRAQPLRLKRGMLYYAHSRKMPVQVLRVGESGGGRDAMPMRVPLVCKQPAALPVLLLLLIHSSGSRP